MGISTRDRSWGAAALPQPCSLLWGRSARTGKGRGHDSPCIAWVASSSARCRCYACRAQQWAARGLCCQGSFATGDRGTLGKQLYFLVVSLGKGQTRLVQGAAVLGAAGTHPGPSSQGWACWQRGTGSATGGHRACVWIKALPLTPPSLHRDTHGAAPVTGGSQGVPREALPRQGTAEALLLGRTWHCFDRHLHLDGSTFPADRHRPEGSSPKGDASSPCPAQPSGSRGGFLEGMCHSPSPLSQHSHPAHLSEVSWPSLSMLPARATVLADWLSCSGHAGPGRGLRLLLGREAAGSGAPSSPALGLGSTDHSSFTAGRKNTLFPQTAPHWSREGTGQGPPAVWDSRLARLSSSTTPTSPGVRPPLQPPRLRHSDSTTVPYTQVSTRGTPTPAGRQAVTAQPQPQPRSLRSQTYPTAMPEAQPHSPAWAESSALTHSESCYDRGHKERQEDTAGDREALLAPG